MQREPKGVLPFLRGCGLRRSVAGVAIGTFVLGRDVLKFARVGDQIIERTSKGYESGPANGPRTWTGTQWERNAITTSGNNYDMGSLYFEADGTWRLIGPTQSGPQPFNPGGEVAMWTSGDQGRTWKMARQLTSGSQRNHTYVRRPVHAHPDFYALWADGHARKPSESRLYFCNKAGDVFVLPAKMEADSAKPERFLIEPPVNRPVKETNR